MNLLKNALELAALGFSVIPLCERDGTPAKAPLGMDSGTVAKYAHTAADEATIREWWGGPAGDGWRTMDTGAESGRREECYWGGANIGAIPGRLSAAIVVDFDPRNTNDLARMMEIAESGPTGLITISPRNDGGHHRWYQWDERLAQIYRGLGGRQDVKSIGVDGIDLPWQVVMPPSLHPAVGGRYEWKNGTPSRDQLGPCPDWLLELADRITRGELAATSDAPKSAATPELDPHDILGGKSTAQQKPTGSVFDAPTSDPWDMSTPVPRRAWLIDYLTHGIKPGERNHGLTRIAGIGYSHGLHVDEAIAIARLVERMSATPGSDDRAEATVRSTYRTAYASQGPQPKPVNNWTPERSWGPDVPAFPTDDIFANCRVARDFCNRSLSEIGVKEAIAGLGVLSSGSTAMLGRYIVRPTPDWTMAPALWCVDVYDTGLRKSAVYKRIMTAMSFLEMHAKVWLGTTKERGERAALHAQLKNQKLKLERAKIESDNTSLLAEVNKAIGQLARYATEQDMHVDGTDSPQAFRLRRLESDGFAIMNEEGRAFFQSLTGSSGSTYDPSVYINAYDGIGVRHKTVGRGREAGAACAASMLLTIQPQILEGLTGTWEGNRSQLDEQGFIPRLLFACPEIPRVLPPTCEGADGETFDDAAEDFGRLLVDVWNAPLKLCGSRSIAWSSQIPVHLRPPAQPHSIYVNFETVAGQLLKNFGREMLSRSHETGDLHAVFGWARRAHGHAARIAAVLHQLENRGTDSPVPLETVNRAIRFTTYYLLPHIIAAYRHMGAWEAETNARAIWKKYRHEKRVVPRKEIMRAFRKPSRTMTDALGLLVEWGYVQERKVQQPGGGRPKEMYRFDVDGEMNNA